MRNKFSGIMSSLWNKGAEMKSWGRWNWSFHSALYAPANRPVILSLLKTLNLKCDRYARLHLVCTRDLHRAGQAHRELLDACKTEEPEIAATEMWKHITEAGN
jgi:DNA-binding GntR family transcriptional regulator